MKSCTAIKILKRVRRPFSYARFGLSVSHLTDLAGVYVIRNTITGEAYVGGSSSIRARVQNHMVMLSRGINAAVKLQESFWQWGLRAFSFEALETCKLVDLNERETHWIQELNPSMNTERIASRVRDETPKLHRLAQRRRAKSEARAQIADAIRGGKSRREVERTFGVSTAIVRRACAVHGVECPQYQRGRPRRQRATS